MIKRVPWPRLVAEAVLVIASILSAFAIDAWWGALQARSSEQELLTALEAGFEEHNRLATGALESLDQDWTLLERFTEMSPDEVEKIPPDSVADFLIALWRPRTGRLNTAALIALTDLGRSSVLSEVGLQMAIADWQAGTENLAVRDVEMAGAERAVVEALSRHTDIQAAFSRATYVFRNFGLGGTVARRVREDPEVMSRVAHKSYATGITVLVLESNIARGDSVLALVRSMRRD